MCLGESSSTAARRGNFHLITAWSAVTIAPGGSANASQTACNRRGVERRPSHVRLRWSTNWSRRICLFGSQYVGLRQTTSSFGHQPPAKFRWNRKELSIRLTDVHARPSSGAPFGAGHWYVGIVPCTQLTALPNELSFVGLSAVARNDRHDAIRSSYGVRTFLSRDAQNSGEATITRSTGLIAVPDSRYALAISLTSAPLGLSETNRIASLRQMRLAVAGCRAR